MTAVVTVGGGGQLVVGRVVAAKSVDAPVVWSLGFYQLVNIVPEPVIPAGLNP